MDAVLTVSELAEALKGVLVHHFGQVAVEGEVTRFTAARSGHWYFSLTDGDATVSAAMFRGDNRRQDWRPREGDAVVVLGRLDYYAPSGRLSLLARRMLPAGAGERQRALEALKARLAEEGLFGADRKQPVPLLPRTIGVATSPTGAALQDVLQVLERRFPGLAVLLAPCRVQGAGAEHEIAEALALLEEDGRADVIIVGRGGGSAEDLWAFNLEPVVRAVAACSIPVISAVGHETDTCLSDLAADLRAPTPSAAAELAVPELAALVGRVEELGERLTESLRRAQARRWDRLGALRLVHPGERLERVRQRHGELAIRLERAWETGRTDRRARLEGLAGRLEALSPLAVLGRGYAFARHDGRIVRQATGLAAGDRLVLSFAEGSVEADVVRVLSQSADPV